MFILNICLVLKRRRLPLYAIDIFLTEQIQLIWHDLIGWNAVFPPGSYAGNNRARAQHRAIIMQNEKKWHDRSTVLSLAAAVATVYSYAQKGYLSLHILWKTHISFKRISSIKNKFVHIDSKKNQ